MPPPPPPLALPLTSTIITIISHILIPITAMWNSSNAAVHHSTGLSSGFGMGGVFDMGLTNWFGTEPSSGPGAAAGVGSTSLSANGELGSLVEGGIMNTDELVLESVASSSSSSSSSVASVVRVVGGSGGTSTLSFALG
ncbi:hypothetical protein CVT25_002031 [Psilocybe cyanescens]|uniref:Uncharacterized protein n=1 Tax=Psilocybe cyanescens TaxID=93625 RepID=A0A409X059_PSICY|nr:hypothetical protein CVT25_002031 [Psilocybe cyanescens]